jgi:hypothetical protein
MKKPIAEIRQLIECAIQRSTETIECFKGQTNPQIVEIYHRKIGEVTAMQSILDALTGRSNLELTLMAKGFEEF